jgi:type II secretory pathway pseudopilin PulG
MKLMFRGKRRAKRPLKDQSGYTMLELVAVVIIIIILVALVFVH